MDKTAVEDFADLAGRARADLKVLENRRDASQERMESNRRNDSISGERDYSIALGRVRALTGAITNMGYFVKALEEAHAREVCRDLKAMPAEEKYGQPCKCGDDLCGYWYCKCPLRSNNSKDNYCRTCYLHNPHLREEIGKWCEATREWTCKCYVGRNWACCGHVFHHTTTGKCNMCNMVNPCPAPKPVYGRWCMCVPKCNSWICKCSNRLQINCVGSCDKCKARRPIEPKPVYGEWCVCGCGQWRCNCIRHGDRTRNGGQIDRCSKCNYARPKRAYK